MLFITMDKNSFGTTEVDYYAKYNSNTLRNISEYIYYNSNISDVKSILKIKCITEINKHILKNYF